MKQIEYLVSWKFREKKTKNTKEFYSSQNGNSVDYTPVKDKLHDDDRLVKGVHDLFITLVYAVRTSAHISAIGKHTIEQKAFDFFHWGLTTVLSQTDPKKSQATLARVKEVNTGDLQTRGLYVPVEATNIHLAFTPSNMIRERELALDLFANVFAKEYTAAVKKMVESAEVILSNYLEARGVPGSQVTAINAMVRVSTKAFLRNFDAVLRKERENAHFGYSKSMYRKWVNTMMMKHLSIFRKVNFVQFYYVFSILS